MGRRGYPAEFRRKVLDLLAEGRSVVLTSNAASLILDRSERGMPTVDRNSESEGHVPRSRLRPIASTSPVIFAAYIGTVSNTLTVL